MIYNRNKKLIIWGGTGNFKVLTEFLDKEYDILGFFDRNIEIQKSYNKKPYLGNLENFKKWVVKNQKAYFICSMGHGLGKERLSLIEMIKQKGLTPIYAIHPTAFVAENVKIGEGSMIFAQSAVCVDSIIGKGCIINTSASVDHECTLDDGVSIGPGAHLAGLVKIGKYAEIYTGATILPRVKIGEGAVVGAGAVVIKDIEPYTTVVGNPAKPIKK